MPIRPVEDDLRDVGKAVAWAEGLVAAAGVPHALRNDIQVCIEEALANLIMHGRAESAKTIQLNVDADKTTALIQISDACAPFDVAAAPLPEADPARTGGAGLKLLRAFAHEVRYARADGRNILTLVFSTEDASRHALDPASLPLVRSIPAFAEMADATLVDLLGAGRLRRYAGGEKLMTQGDPSEHAVLLLDGDVAVLNESRHGAAPVARISAPALLGEIGALARLPRTASIVATGPIKVLEIDREPLLDAFSHAPAMLVSVIAQLGTQIKNTNTALGLYASGFAALERGDIEAELKDDLRNPSGELRNFATAFERLAQRITQERRTRNEMESAALIQRQMLPLGVTDPAGRCDLHAEIRTARNVGGDFYDMIWLDDHRLALAVGDVCGKGSPAALFMCVTVTMLRLAAREGLPLDEMMRKVNALLYAQNPSCLFATLFFGVLDLETRTLAYLNCGHNPPYVLSADGACAELASGGPPLGVVPDKLWPMHTLALKLGDGLFVFSDGVTEAMDPAQKEYGDERLANLLRAQTGWGAEALIQTVMADVDRFAAGAEQADDITCLAMVLR